MSQNSAAMFEREDAPGRRKPVQPRSEATVERIKRAMLELIEAEGYTAASTNRIAERARVNIASLYRYFPNRASIALALYESASAGLGRVVHQWLTSHMAEPVETSMRKLVNLVLDYVEREQVALLRLRDEVPELRDGVQPMSLETLAYHPSRIYLEQQLGPMDKATATRKMFFVQNMGMGLIRRYVMERPRGLTKPQFAAELSNLIVLYLRSPMPAGKPNI